MQDILRLAKKSAKAYFKTLRAQSPLECSCLGVLVQVTQLFLQHIYSFSRKRSQKDLIMRMLSFPFLIEVLQFGALVEVRHQAQRRYYKISLEKGIDCIQVIILKRGAEHILLSCFVDKKKEPVLASDGHSGLQ